MAMYMYFQKIKFSPLGIYAGVGKVDFMKYVNQIIHISLLKIDIYDVYPNADIIFYVLPPQCKLSKPKYIICHRICTMMLFCNRTFYAYSMHRLSKLP